MLKRLPLLNLVFLGAAVVFALFLVRNFTTARQLPSPPVSSGPPPLAVNKEATPSPQPPLPTYGVIASKNLFNPNRSDTATASAAPVSKPVLYGVVLRDGAPAAFLEDPTTKKVVSYKPGDAVAGGQLERIEADRVVIRRGEETFEVLLQDPTKPKPVAVAPSSPAGARPGGPAPQAQGPATPPVQPPAVAAPPRPSPLSIFRRPQAPAVPPVTNAPSQ